MDFPNLFQSATGHPPHAWQGRLANGERYRAEAPETHQGSPCESEPITGQPSCAKRALDLRDTLGPFLLAFLETLLRAVDARVGTCRSQTNAEQAEA